MEGAVRSPSALMATAYGGASGQLVGFQGPPHSGRLDIKALLPPGTQAHNTSARRTLACTTYVVLAIRLLAGHDGLVREVGLQMMLMHASSDPPTGHTNRL